MSTKRFNRIAAVLVIAVAMCARPINAVAQSGVPQVLVVTTCGSPTYPTGTARPATQDIHGNLCNNSTGGGGGAVTTTPGQRTLVTLDVKTVTTGGTAVTALSAGHRAAGGFLYNPISATVPLCINEIGTATGTTSSGDTTCVQPGQAYTVAPAATAVSVISSDSSHPFSGYGLQ